MREEVKLYNVFHQLQAFFESFFSFGGERGIRTLDAGFARMLP
jgi:hypothetical protein